MKKISSSKIGKYGETLAFTFLKSKGYSICCTNYHSRYGEIDIIAQNSEYIIFVEVKTRKCGTFIAPLEYVDSKKRQKIIKTALIYLSENQTFLQPRFDVIEVILNIQKNLNKLHHIPNAFTAENSSLEF